MREVRRSLKWVAPLLMLLLATPAAEVPAASALGRANATVMTPSVVAPVSVSVAMPSVVTRVATARATANRMASASVIGSGLAGTDMITVAGVAVERLGDGAVLSFSVAGDTTSAYVVHLGASDSPAQPFAAGAGTASDALPGLILTAQPLSGSGQLSVVLSQTPSELIAGAVSLSVNFN